MNAKARAWVRVVSGTAFLSGLIFLPAWGLHYWRGWLYLGVNALFFAVTAWVLRRETGLVSERLRPGRGMIWWDKGYYLLSTPLYMGAIVLAAIDGGRRHWSSPPGAIPLAAAVASYVAGQSLFLWAKKANPFFSSVVRIQTDRGQTVCRSGPYRLCRHPGYLGGLLFGLATPVILGSYWALVPQGLAALLLVVRAFLEDRLLARNLLWYSEYKQAVRAMLVPGLF